MDTLIALQEWYAKHCDGEREHRHGINIESTDNPGWWVRVDLAGTELEGRAFDPITVNVNSFGHPQDKRWLCCLIKEGVWDGAGDETKLQDILQTFLTWANEVSQPCESE